MNDMIQFDFPQFMPKKKKEELLFVPMDTEQTQTTTPAFLPKKTYDNTSTLSNFLPALSETTRKFIAQGPKGVFSKQPAPTWKEAGKQFAESAKESMMIEGVIDGQKIKAFNPIAILSGEPLKNVSNITPKSNNLTTKFLDYVQTKLAKDPNATLSRQEIADFAKRPELKKGEADLILKKLDEFEPKKPLLQGQKLFTIVEDTTKIDTYIQKEFGGRIPDNELIDLGTVEDMISNEKVKDIFKDVLDVQITMTEKFERPTIQAQIGKLPDDRLQIQIRRGLSEEQFNRSLTEELFHALRIRKGRTNYEAEQLLNYYERPTEKSAKAGVSKLLGEDFFGLPVQQRISAQDFVDSIRRDLLELKPVKVKDPQYKGTTLQSRVAQNEDFRPVDNSEFKNYEEVVFESPITTNGSSHYPNSKNYFAHARGDEVVEGGKKIWREQEIQSDALQKEGLERMKNIGTKYVTPEIADAFKQAGKLTELQKQRLAEVARLEPFGNDRFGERIIRERIRAKFDAGYDSYMIPTGETIGKIEGFANTDNWLDIGANNRRLTSANDLKIGKEIAQPAGDSWIITDILGNGRFKAVPKEYKKYWENSQKAYVSREAEWKNEQMLNGVEETFDLTGKSNPQYRRYENWGKFMKNNYNGYPYTDPQGNTWMKADRPANYKKGMPIEAFGMAALPFLPKDKQLFVPYEYQEKEREEKIPIRTIKATPKTKPLPKPTEINSVGGYNFAGYASATDAIPKIRQFYKEAQNLTNAKSFNKEIDRLVIVAGKETPITGWQIVRSAVSHGIDPRILFALIRKETSAGMNMKSKNNPANIGNTDDGKIQEYESIEEGLDAASREIQRREI